jgi:hypothetical protein
MRVMFATYWIVIVLGITVYFIETFQNWQSEFLAVGTMARVLA